MKTTAEFLEGRDTWQPHEYAVEVGVSREVALAVGRRLAPAWREDVLYYHCGPDVPPCRREPKGKRFPFPFLCSVCDEEIQAGTELSTDVMFSRVKR